MTNKINRAFVLAAGLGMRLRPLTDDLPKPLVPIFQKPLITFAFDHLLAAGIMKFVVNTHRLPERFAEVFPENTYRDQPIQFVHEPTLLETGGGIKNAEEFLRGEPFITYSADVLTDVNLGFLIEEHFRNGNDVTLALREAGLRADIAVKNGRVVDIGNRYGVAGTHDYAGIALWNPTVFGRLPKKEKFSFIPVLTEWIGQNGKIGGVALDEGNWFNLGSSSQYLEIHRCIANETWIPPQALRNGWPLPIAPDASVNPSAKLEGFYAVGSRACIEAGVRLRDTIIWPGAQIASETSLENCIVRSQRTAEGQLRDTII